MGQRALALFHRHGWGGLRKDAVAAARLYSLAADQGDGISLLRLGDMLDEGVDGVVSAEAFVQGADVAH
jgi:TPR repeat protein